MGSLPCGNGDLVLYYIHMEMLDNFILFYLFIYFFTFLLFLTAIIFRNGVLRKLKHLFPNTYQRIKA